MKIRQKLLLGNWKCHKNYEEVIKYANYLNEHFSAAKLDCKFGIAPSFLHLFVLNQHLNSKDIIVSAQDAFYEPYGAFTSCVSAVQLVNDQIKYCLIGHSERRSLFYDNLVVIQKKVNAALSAGLNVVFCFGETLDQFENNQTKNVLKNQIDSALKNIDPKYYHQVILAYEPVWAIGTGKTATAQQAQDIICYVRNELLTSIWSKNVAKEIIILYGGSVNLSNIKNIVNQEDVDGALVGGASLDPLTFLNMAKAIKR